MAVKQSLPPPEATIPNTTRKVVLDTLVSAAMSAGAELKSLNDYVAVFDKPDTSFSGAVLYGSRYNRTPNMRLTFTTVQSQNAVRVFAKAGIVTNPGSQHERIRDVTNDKNIRRDLESMLDRLKTKL